MPVVALTALLLAISGSDAGLQDRLDRLVDEMESSRVEYHVPGMTLAVVKDGEIVLVHAFGEQDLETGEAMTVDTLLPIGSSTKAFTSTSIGMLADDGTMAWDDPVTRHLPELDLQIRSDDPDDVATIRDLLSHRTGFPRMGVLWAGATASRDEIFGAASRAEAQADFREEFLYNNIMYLGAGEAAAAASGQSWESLVQARILDPLQMTGTIMVVDTPEEIEQVSRGYMWDSELDEYQLQTFRTIESCSPAGSICSTPGDMAKWVRFQLADGMVGDRRLISEGTLDQTHQEQIKMSSDLGYGLGWMLEEWKGRRVIQHGGNIDGYSAMVAFIPEEDVGFTLLMNSMPTAMQEASKSIVWRTMLLEPEDKTAAPQADLDRNTGSYVANFGPFSDAIMEVTAKDGALFLDVPGQINYELVAPGEGEERWPFKMSDAIAVSFHEDDSGDVTLMKMYQASMVFEMPREGSSLPPGPFQESEVRKFFGMYQQVHDVTKDRVDEIRLEDGWLVIDIPGQMVFKLSSPGEDGRYAFRDVEGIAVSFPEREDGSVDEIIIHQSGIDFPGTRVGGPPETVEEPEVVLPSLEEILAVRAAHVGKPLEPDEALDFRGEMIVPSAGVVGEFTLVLSRPDRFFFNVDFGPFGQTKLAVNGEYGAEVSDFYPDRMLVGHELELAQLGQGILFGSWKSQFENLAVVGESEVDGVPTIKIEARPAESEQPFVLHVDPKTGSLRKANIWVFLPNMGPYPMEFFVGELEEIEGIVTPRTWWLYSDESGEVRYNVESATRITPVQDDLFHLKEFPLLEEGS